MKPSIDTYTNTPSLLRQIVDEVDALDEAGKMQVLRKAKLQKALLLAKTADQELEGKFQEIDEDELAKMVSENREKWYSIPL